MLPEIVCDRCRDQGRLTVDSYRRNLNPRSLSVSSRGAQWNAPLQADGKMAECAVALFLGRSPFDVGFGRYADNGSDIDDFGGIDVKHTRRGTLLIWPVNKRHFFFETSAEILVLVRGVSPRFEICGFTDKDFFGREHHEAGAGRGLDPGTWYLEEDELQDPRLLRPTMSKLEQGFA